MATRIGIVQGRLTPPVRGIQAFPRDHWREEFANGKAAGIDLIEWIYDGYGADVNPLMTAQGIVEMQALSAASGVAVESVCADYFMEQPLLNCTPDEQRERLNLLFVVLNHSKQLGARSVVLPFVDNSAIDSEAQEQAFIALMHTRILPHAERLGIEIHMETSLPPLAVARVLAQLEHPLFWINYDSGNSASLGYAPRDEFAAYGARIGSFHVKDRVLGGFTVPLGQGDTDFAALAECLKQNNYRRNYILQVARGEPGDEIAWARQNRAYTETHLLAAA